MLKVEKVEEVAARVVVVAAVVVGGEVVAEAAPRAAVAMGVVVGKAAAVVTMEKTKVQEVVYGKLKLLEEVNHSPVEVANLHTRPRTTQVLQATQSRNGK